MCVGENYVMYLLITVYYTANDLFQKTLKYGMIVSFVNVCTLNITDCQLTTYQEMCVYHQQAFKLPIKYLL